MDLEFNKPPEKIEVPELKHPPREEYRRLVKTGADSEGHPVHPDDLKNLRKATMADLLAFGGEVNKANVNLKTYVDKISGEHQWTLLNLIAYLIDKKILPENADKDFADYMVKSKEALDADIEMAKKFLAEKQKKDIEDNPKVLILDTPKVLIPDDVKKEDKIGN